MSPRPNILLFLTDDQGPWALPWITPELRMPALEEFASEAYVFTQMHTPSPVCSPARASILTGTMPSTHGVHDWLTGTRHPRAQADTYLDHLETLPQILHRSGYTCALSGKWHLGDSCEPAPGFSSWYAHRYGGGPYMGAPIWKDGHEAEEELYFTEAVGVHALEFLRERAAATGEDGERQPFFLFAATTAPHDPWGEDQHPDELLDIYAGEEFPTIPREEPHPWADYQRVHQFADAYRDPVPSLRGYCAALSGVDRIFGSLVDELKKQGEWENTIVIFMSDNGFSCGHHGIWGKGNGTFPLNFWDNSVRVPFLIRIPEAVAASVGIDPGRERGYSSPVNELISSLNLFTSLCELAGVECAADVRRGQGTLLDILRGKSGSDSVAVFDEYGAARMIRRGMLKYVWREEGPEELYDLECDPDERRNLIDDPTYSGIQSELRNELDHWFEVHEDPRFSGIGLDVTGLGQIMPLWRSRETEAFVQFGEE